MKQYSVKITVKALVDMDAIYGYIAETLLEPETAMKQYDRIVTAIESLCSLPERHPLLDAQPECDLGMRRLLIDNYVVIYVVLENTVTVLRVFYSSSDFVSRLRDGR